jgi:hypothetical protein
MKIHNSETLKRIARKKEFITQSSEGKNNTFFSLEEIKKRKQYEDIFSNSINNFKERVIPNKPHFPIKAINYSVIESLDREKGMSIFKENLMKNLGKYTAPNFQINEEKQRQDQNLMQMTQSYFNSPKLSECLDIFLEKPSSNSKINLILEDELAKNDIGTELYGRKLVREISEKFNIKNEVLEYFNLNNSIVEGSQSSIFSSNQNNSLNINNRLKTVKEKNKIVEIECKQSNSNKNDLENLRKSSNKVENDNLCKESDYYSSFPVKNVNSDEETLDVEIKSFPILVFRYNSFLRDSIDFVNFVIVYYTSTFTPIHLCLFYKNLLMEITEIMFELISILDIISNFFKSYLDNEENQVTDLRKIAKNYLFNWFLLDLIICFPYEIISSILSINYVILSYNSTTIDLNFLKWLKLLRLLKLLYQSSFIKFLSPALLNKNNTMNRMIKFILFFAIFSHICSCFFIYLGLLCRDSDNWISNANIDPNSFLQIYIAALYYILVTIYSIGYGDIKPVNLIEKIWVIIFMMVGNRLYSYAISSLSTIFLQQNKSCIE